MARHGSWPLVVVVASAAASATPSAAAVFVVVVALMALVTYIVLSWVTLDKYVAPRSPFIATGFETGLQYRYASLAAATCCADPYFMRNVLEAPRVERV